ncbi:pectinesterase inhibitor 10-like [Lactuca sativa]|uniref:pectinesterase inhibitor 10-like n=1 Tax=Lactuca sativa TaxID=4236 RepID=UPI000CD9B7BA|nr:pectinesterase inhibitor 10-like [Lactuca sativa]
MPVFLAPISPPISTQPASTSPLPPPVITFPISTAPLPPPIIFQVTTTTTTEPPARVNVSDMGAPTVGTETPITPKPLSPSSSTDSEPILSGDNFHFNSTYYSPYRLPCEDEDDAPDFLDTALQQYSASIDKSRKAMDASTSSCKKAIADVIELIHDSKVFFESLKGHADSNASKVNATVDLLSKLLQEENTKFDSVRSRFQVDHTTFLSSVNTCLDKL